MRKSSRPAAEETPALKKKNRASGKQQYTGDDDGSSSRERGNFEEFSGSHSNLNGWEEGDDGDLASTASVGGNKIGANKIGGNVSPSRKTASSASQGRAGSKGTAGAEEGRRGFQDMLASSGSGSLDKRGVRGNKRRKGSSEREPESEVCPGKERGFFDTWLTLIL